MTAVPNSPGVGPRRYQPVASAGSDAGVAMLPSAARPTLTTLARTPSDGIEIRVGTDGPNPSVEPPTESPELERPGRLGSPKICPNPNPMHESPTSIRAATSGSTDRGPELARTALAAGSSAPAGGACGAPLSHRARRP